MSKKLGDLRPVPWAEEERQVRHLKLLHLTHPVGGPYGLSALINDYKWANKVRAIMQHVVLLVVLSQLQKRGRQLLPYRMS